MEYTIFAERCSGTNYFDNLIDYHFNLKKTNKFGWKHGIPGSDNDPLAISNLKDTQNVIFFVVVRNPYDWIRSFYINPWHASIDILNILNFSDFIRHPWMSNWFPDSHNDPLSYMSLDQDENNNFFKTPLHLRTSKLKTHLNLKNIVPNFFLVNYDFLIYKPYDVLLSISNTFNLSFKNSFKDITNYKKENFKYKPFKYFSLNIDDINFINDSLNWDIEISIGYTPLNPSHSSFFGFDIIKDQNLPIVSINSKDSSDIISNNNNKINHNRLLHYNSLIKQVTILNKNLQTQQQLFLYLYFFLIILSIILFIFFTCT